LKGLVWRYLDSDLFVTKPMVTGDDEGTILGTGMIIEPSSPGR